MDGRVTRGAGLIQSLPNASAFFSDLRWISPHSGTQLSGLAPILTSPDKPEHFLFLRYGEQGASSPRHRITSNADETRRSSGERRAGTRMAALGRGGPGGKCGRMDAGCCRFSPRIRRKTIHVWTRNGLVTCCLLFFIDLATQRVHLAGLTANLDEAWMLQVARNVTDAEKGFLCGKRHLLMDRDAKCSEAFRLTLGEGGIELVLLPSRSPNGSPPMECFLQSEPGCRRRRTGRPLQSLQET